MRKRKRILLYIFIAALGLLAIGHEWGRSTPSDETEMGERTVAEDRPGEGFQLSQVPSYAGSPFTEVNDSRPFFGDAEKKRTDGFETYSELDALGRCGVAYANLSRELMPEEERGEIGQIRPSGWHTVKYSDLIEDRYLYNRCHLIAYSLAGENANEKNLITGTRYLNKEGMLPFELRVVDYIRSTGNHVLYRVTPVFEGENLVASGVLMEAWSVEDAGKGISFCVYCYNVQPGIVIEYLTGESRREGSDDRSVTEEPETADATKEEEFILNTSSRKIHLPTCDSLKDMKEKNKEFYTGTIEELKEKGYTPCRRCLGEE